MQFDRCHVAALLRGFPEDYAFEKQARQHRIYIRIYETHNDRIQETRYTRARCYVWGGGGRGEYTERGNWNAHTHLLVTGARLLSS